MGTDDGKRFNFSATFCPEYAFGKFSSFSSICSTIFNCTLLIMTDDKRMMGQFKNRKIWSIPGWGSSIILIFMNLCNLSATFVSFNIMPKRNAVVFAYAIIMLIILLMGWTCWDMRKKK